VAQHADARLDGVPLTEPCRDLRGRSRLVVLGHNNDAGAAAGTLTLDEPVGQGLQIRRRLWNDHLFGAPGDSGANGESPAVPAHDLNQEHAVEGLGRVANAVNGVERRVQRGVIADRVVGPAAVVVDRAGQEY